MLGYAKPPPNLREIAIALNVIKPVPLMVATEDELKLSEKGTAFNSTVGHSSIVNEIPITPNNVWSNISISEVSFNQNSELKTTDVWSTEDSTTSIHLSQIGSSQIGFSQVTPRQVSRIQISIPDNSAFQPSIFQGNTKKIGSSQIRSNTVRLVYLALGDPPNPPFLRGAFPPIYPLKKGVK
jgi:hypothetical protein